VADVIYNPGRTNLLLQAEEIDHWWRMPGDALSPPGGRGIRYAGGLSMLVAQAKRAEELFFGPSIPDEETEKITARLWRDRTNLVLVGMPGSGKTTVGQELAKRSGKPFVDLDEEIARRAGRPIPEIFAQEGEGAFRKLEHEVLEEACAGSGQVIATGGGAVLWSENRAAMRRTGWVCRLRRKLEDLAVEGRPLSQAGKLEEMERVRDPLYTAAADREIWNVNNPEETAGEIWRDFCEQ
jgi:shikimate dehydrogenase